MGSYQVNAKTRIKKNTLEIFFHVWRLKNHDSFSLSAFAYLSHSWTNAGSLREDTAICGIIPLAHWFFALWIVLQARAITRTNRIIDAVNRCCYPFEMLGRAVVEVLVPVSLNIWQLCCSMEAFILWSRLSSVPVPFGLFRCANGHLISQVRPTCPRLIILCLVYSLHQVIHHCYWRFLVQQ